MNEPSVLDFVIAKIRFWEKSNLHLPPPVEAMPLDAALSPDAAAPGSGSENASINPASGFPAGGIPTPGIPAAAGYPAAEREQVHVPWLALAPLGVAILAQFFLEPPNRAIAPAAIFYCAAFVLTLLAFSRGYLRPAEHAAAQPRPDAMEMRWGEALIGIPIAAVAFILFGKSPFTAYDNRFTLINVALWLAALGLFLYAFVQPRRLQGLRDWLAARWQALRAGGWTFRLSGFAVLLVLVTALTLFFRFYRMDQIPIDMVSDHAEKLLDINDVINGIPSIFFERNTGREPFQFYWTVLVMKIFNLPVSFYALKLGTVLVGLITCYYTYKLANLIANRWVALIALLFVGVAYWPNVISRIALRFPLYAFFVAPLLFYLIRGLRNSARNDFIWAGLWLGIGLNGYTSGRIVPFLVIIAVGLYLLHRRSKGFRREAILGFLLVTFFSVVVCLPLMRYGLEHPDAILFRSLTRIASLEHPIPGSPVLIFLSNFWAAITMFFYSNGSVWVHSIPYRPALDLVMAALFFVGAALLLARYIKARDWEDALLLISVPVL
ncbi:MAG TPA: glycosyltransferase family 39 protein, partial [Anaerolineaceae bacterium]